MYVKMMGHAAPCGILTDFGAPLPPATFRVWQCVADVNIIHAHEDNVLLPDVFKLELTFEDHIRLTVDVLGPVYIMNDQGKTIEKFECAPRAPYIPWQGHSAYPHVTETADDKFVPVPPAFAEQVTRPPDFAPPRRDRSDPEGGIPGRG